MQPEPFGKYVLLSRLGSGGMAEVFLARAQSIGGFEKLLAIKRLLPFCTEDPETVDLLADEARITVRLTHPNIVQVFDFGRVADSYYIAMEYVDGLDLKSLIRKDEVSSTPMEPRLAVHVASCILDALDFAHTQRDAKHNPLGIIHRDVSPHNVLISRHGQVKLADFGVARAAISCHVSHVGDIRGKFSYMPPEQVCGGDIDHRVDIFAAGAILYELLSGRQPYRSASVGEQLELLRFDMVRPSELQPRLPSKLDAICMRALDKDPANRFASAAEFAAALRQEVGSVGGAALPPTGPLADLVEQRLVRMAKSPPEHRSELMVLGDYSGADDSLISQPRQHGAAGDPEPPVRARQTRRERALTPPPRRQSARIHVDTDPDAPPLLALATHLEARRGATVGPASQAAEEADDDQLTTIADVQLTDTYSSGEVSTQPGGTPPEGESVDRAAPARRPPRPWDLRVQVVVVALCSLALGVALAVVLATC